MWKKNLTISYSLKRKKSCLCPLSGSTPNVQIRSDTELVTILFGVHLETVLIVEIFCAAGSTCVWSIDVLLFIAYSLCSGNPIYWPITYKEFDCVLFVSVNLDMNRHTAFGHMSSMVLLILIFRRLSLHHVMKVSISPLYSSLKNSLWQHVSNWKSFHGIINVNIVRIAILSKIHLINSLKAFSVYSMFISLTCQTWM